ncbi:MAG: hypothetical protein JWM11_5986 [Planctomycetaceae bacterium]|nr:hypothetical protein [Planctomycetaceae bacterium]
MVARMNRQLLSREWPSRDAVRDFCSQSRVGSQSRQRLGGFAPFLSKSPNSRATFPVTVAMRNSSFEMAD